MSHREQRTVWLIKKVATGQYFNNAETGFSAGNPDNAKQYDDMGTAKDKLHALGEAGEQAGFYVVEELQRFV